MGIFSGKKPEDKLSYKKKSADKISKAEIKYISERVDDGSSNGREEVLCHGGRANIMNDMLIISSSEKDIFKCEIKNLKASEFYSKEGCIVQGPDLFNEGKFRTIILYYTRF